MKSKINKLIILLTLLVSACATVKIPLPDTGNKDEGRVNLTYSYGLFEKPKVNWDQALVAATGQCKQWGYSPASKTSGPVDECIKIDQNNNCIQHLVTTSYQCQLSTAQLKAQDDERKKLAKVEKAKAKQFAIDYPYTAIFVCGDDTHWNIYTCLQGSDSYYPDSHIEITNGMQYGLYQSYELDKVGRETPEGFVIPLRNNFTILTKNSSDSAKLTLFIKNNATGQIVLTKSVLRFGVISVKN